MKVGRNDPCHCGSGQKYKKCCLAKDEAARASELVAPTPPQQATAEDGNSAARTDKEPARRASAPRGAEQRRSQTGRAPTQIRRRAV